MKPAAWRFARDIYPVRFAVQTRYRDMDMLEHVNNIAQAAYYDEARHRFSQMVFGHMGDRSGVRIVTADSHVHYLAEVFHPDEIEVGTGVLRIGASSYQIGQAMFQKGACTGVCATTFVRTADGRAAPLQDAFRAALGHYLIAAPEGAVG